MSLLRSQRHRVGVGPDIHPGSTPASAQGRPPPRHDRGDDPEPQPAPGSDSTSSVCTGAWPTGRARHGGG